MVIIGSGNAKAALKPGWEILQKGGSALDAVEAAIRIVEDDPDDHSVGTGGWPNIQGEVELDASIMDGGTRACGAVGAVSGFPNPISIARRLMESLPHVFLVGRGAEIFAEEAGFIRREILTDRSKTEWEERLRANVPADRMADVFEGKGLSEWALLTKDPQRVGGTVNVIALDGRGELASGVSTCGWAWKYPGRLGDSPVIGAGNYCDSRYGASACTGHGELAIRAGAARGAVLYMQMGNSVKDAGFKAFEGVPGWTERYQSILSMVLLDPSGDHCGITTDRNPRQYAVISEKNEEPQLLPYVRVPE